MAVDRRTLENVATGGEPPTVRFFRWASPTVSFGRLQQLEKIRPFVPKGWPAVQRPTGGGIVFHTNDLCFSMCWRRGQTPLPAKPTEQYRWIHTLAQEALEPLFKLQMATQTSHDLPSFERRQCFTHPVKFDVMNGTDKVIGGALAARREAMLYQGSIQVISSEAAEPLLTAMFQKKLNAHL